MKQKPNHLPAGKGTGLWKRLDSKVLLEHPRMKVIEDSVQLPNGATVPYLRFSTGGNGVTIICVKDDKILLQREYSYPVNEILLQLPGGKVNKDESPVEAARRELIEESGLQLKEAKPLGWYYPNNRRTDAKMHVILATSVTEIKKQEGDLEETIESLWVPMAELKQMIRRGEVTNYSILAAWTMFEQHTFGEQ